MREKSAREKRLWWSGVADALAAIADQADEHLPGGFNDRYVPGNIKEDILNSLRAALACADSAAHAYIRAERDETPAPVAAPPAQTAPPAPMVAPPAGSEWAHARPTGRGWTR